MIDMEYYWQSSCATNVYVGIPHKILPIMSMDFTKKGKAKLIQDGYKVASTVSYKDVALLD